MAVPGRLLLFNHFANRDGPSLPAVLPNANNGQRGNHPHQQNQVPHKPSMGPGLRAYSFRFLERREKRKEGRNRLAISQPLKGHRTSEAYGIAKAMPEYEAQRAENSGLTAESLQLPYA